MRLPLAIALAFLLAGCAEERVVYDLRVVSPSGGAPLEGRAVDALRVHFAQAPDPITTFDVPVEDGAFDASLPLVDLNAETRIALEFTGPVDALFGALPPHAPAEADLGATLVVGPRASCAPFAAIELVAPASSVGGAAVGTYGLLVGGVEASGNSARIGFVDLLRATGDALEPAPSPLGATRAVAVTSFIALVIPTEGAPFFYDLGDEDARIFPAAIHADASNGGALVAAGTLGAIAVGGANGDTPSAGLSYVAADGTITLSSLVRPRRGAAAAFAGDRLWVAAGEGASSLELASFGAAPAEVVDLGDAVRIGGHLFVADDGTEALLVGGVDAGGTPRTDTVHVHGCPGACAAEPGPAWAHARAGVVAVPGDRLLVGGTTDRTVERIDFTEVGPSFVARGQLEVGRLDPAVIPVGEGVFLAVGGHDGAGPRRDAEICFP